MLYQPSFAYPHNQSIDCTDEDDMKFSWQLNGNNLLCGYNIQIYDLDTNNLVWELVSTQEQRDIIARIEELAGYVELQRLKIARLDENEALFNDADYKTEFKNQIDALNGDRQRALADYARMVELKERIHTATEPLKADGIAYLEKWASVNGILSERINGDGTSSVDITGLYAKYIESQCEDFIDVDPERKDGIEYEVETHQTNTILLTEIEKRLEDSELAYSNAYAIIDEDPCPLTQIASQKTLEQGENTAYSIYSKFSSEKYYFQDLYTAVCDIIDSVDFDKKREEVNYYMAQYQEEMSQLSYALSFFTGGKTKEIVPIYLHEEAIESELLINIEEGETVAVIGTPSQSGWYEVSYQGVFGYAQLTSENFSFYEIATEAYKYLLEKPIPPTNFEGKPNTIIHQLPTDWEQFPPEGRMQNGKDYKWTVTLFWNTSGDYSSFENIDGALTSVEYYFNTRKKPRAWLNNWKEVFCIPNNIVQISETTYLNYEYEGEQRTKELLAGDNVILIHYAENGTLAYIRTEGVEEGSYIYGNIPAESLVDGGLYENGESANTLYEVNSKYITFIGGYEQEQHSAVSYFRWVLCKLQNDTEEVVEVVKDTGMIPSIDVKMFYDGFLNGEKYSIKLYIQTVDNIYVESIEYKFIVHYIDYKIENMVNAENSPIEHGVIVEWSNLRLIQGEITGDSHYETGLPTENKTALTLDKGSNIVFDKDKKRQMSLDWNANQILSIRFDEDRAPSQEYYVASGKDDNNEFIYKSLRLEERPDTDETGLENLVYTIHENGINKMQTVPIIVSPLYWYIVIMTSKELIVYVKYADGLFPMQELYANLNNFTHSSGITPLPLRYYNEPSERVIYDYQTIINRDGSYKDGQGGN